MIPKGNTTSERIDEHSANSLSRIAGDRGWVVLPAASSPIVGLKVRALQPLTGAVTFTVYEEDGVSQFTARKMSGIPFPVGSYLPAPVGKFITEVAFTGGDILAYY